MHPPDRLQRIARHSLTPATKAESWSLYLIVLVIGVFAFKGALGHSEDAKHISEANRRAIAAQGAAVASNTRLIADESRFISSGIPATVCLLDVFSGVRPAFERLPPTLTRKQRELSNEIGDDLESFLILQGKRFQGYPCPSPAQARTLSHAIPTVKSPSKP